MKVCATCQSEFARTVSFCPHDGTTLREASLKTDSLIGSTLDGQWLINDKIAEGGMGSIYRGRQLCTDRPVAVKTLRATAPGTADFSRVLREAQLATRLDCPHCIEVLDFGRTEDGTMFLVMEYLEGVSLSTKISTGQLHLELIVEIGTQVASALTSTHASSVVHRDLKPDNIFLVERKKDRPHVKLLDFGSAVAVDSEVERTQTGPVVGTPEYMSPEQCSGNAVDGRSDLYSLGCILYELISGRSPFSASTPMGVMLKHVNDEPAELRSVSAVAIPGSLNHVVMKLLNKRADDRYPSAAVLKMVLERERMALGHPTALATGERAFVTVRENRFVDEPVEPPAREPAFVPPE